MKAMAINMLDKTSEKEEETKEDGGWITVTKKRTITNKEENKEENKC